MNGNYYGEYGIYNTNTITNLHMYANNISLFSLYGVYTGTTLTVDVIYINLPYLPI